MNSLFKKFLFYNFIGLIILAVVTIALIFFSNQYQLNKRLSQINNQTLMIYNVLNSSNILRDVEKGINLEKAISNLEIKNLSILILDSNRKVLFDSKGYDLDSDSFEKESYVTVESINDEEQGSKLLNKVKNTSNRAFLKNDLFIENFNDSRKGDEQMFSIKLPNNKLYLISIFPINYLENEYFIVAQEDNTEIGNIIDQIRLNVLMGVLAIAMCLIIFSIFLNYVILSPIRLLAGSAIKIQNDFKSKPSIIGFDKRTDEIGDLSKILNNMLQNLYLKIDNTENYSADLMHEIRNPLASIKMASEVITDDMTENQKKFLNLIQTDISRIENIITDYSAMIKDEALLSKSVSKKFNITSLILSIIDGYKKISKGSTKFEFISDKDISNKLFAKGQESFIEQAIKNVIDNAISFAGKEGVVTLSLSSTSNYLTISISDNGPGIKEPNIDRIFDRFYSLREQDQISDRVHSGLGLNIAKQIVDSHGGYITANNISEDNIISGSRFIINLPLGN